MLFVLLSICDHLLRQINLIVFLQYGPCTSHTGQSQGPGMMLPLFVDVAVIKTGEAKGDFQGSKQVLRPHTTFKSQLGMGPCASQ